MKTALAEAFAEAGVDDAAIRLRQIARDTIAATGFDFEAAREQLLTWIAGDGPLLYALIVNGPEAARNSLLDAALAPAAEEMRAGRGQRTGEAHGRDAPTLASHAEPGTGHNSAGAHVTRAHPVRQQDAEGRGHLHGATHGRHASPSAAHLDAVGHAGAVAARSILDTFHITERQGSKTPIGDVHVTSYRRLIAAHGRRTWVASREYNLLCLLDAEAKKQAHIPAGAKTRDVFDAAAVAALVDTASVLAMPKIPERDRAEAAHA